MVGTFGFDPTVGAQVLPPAGDDVGQQGSVDNGGIPSGAPAGLEEIIVTTQRRAESLQSVPLSISAFTPRALELKQIEVASQLQIAVPGLIYGSSGSWATPYLRGIGSDIATIGAEAGVATYLDGIYVSSPISVNMDLIDVERIEVAKGPQSTLYGRNAVGGAINIITRQPTHEFVSELVAGYGNHDRFEAAGEISGGISDTVFVGAYANYLRRDPITEDLLSSSDLSDVPDYKELSSIRLKGVFAPTSAAKFVLSAEYTGTNDDPDVWSFRQVQSNALGILAGGRTSTEPNKVYLNYPSYQESRNYGVTLQAELDLSFAQLVSLTGYRDVESLLSTDFDGTDAAVQGFSIDPQFSRQFSQEIRLVSNQASRLKWVAGLFYFDEDTGGVINLLPGTLLVRLHPKLPVESYAAFAELTVPVNDKLNLTAGFRETHEEKSISSKTTIPSLDVEIPAEPQSETYNEPTWKAGIDYHFTPDLMGYLTYSRGFQSGAFNAADATSPPVDPEILDAYEVGVKSEWLDSRVQVNASAFYYDFSDLQVQVTTSDTAAAAKLQNAGAARVIGVEASVSALPANNLQLDATVTYLDSEYRDFTNFAGYEENPAGGNSSVPVDVTGNEIVRAPRWTGSVGAVYTAALSGGSRLELSGTYYYNDGFAFDPQHFAVQDAYSQLNASVSWVASEQYRLSLWGQNLTDSDYYTWAVASNFGTGVRDAPGRLFGIRLIANFAN